MFSSIHTLLKDNNIMLLRWPKQRLYLMCEVYTNTLFPDTVYAKCRFLVRGSNGSEHTYSAFLLHFIYIGRIFKHILHKHIQYYKILNVQIMMYCYFFAD